MLRSLATVKLALVISFQLVNWTAAQEPDYRLYDEIASQRKIIGPLVGHVTDDTAYVWAYAGPRAKSLVLNAAEIASPDKDSSRPPFAAHMEQATNEAEHNSVEFHLQGLSPETTYAYAIHLADDPQVVEAGTFTTAPAGKKAKFRLAVASCFGNSYKREDGRTRATREYVNDSWRLLMNQRPDLELIIGDVVYADSTDYNHLWDSHTLERLDNRPFAQAIRTIPTYAVWDDHDYGPNNSDGTAQGKEQSLRAFGEVYANPPRSGEGGPGVYTNFSWGGVDFFLLDGRYHRTPNDAPDDEKKDYLGEEQLKWLVERLKASEAPFKVLVNGSTWNTSKDDSWRLFTAARRKLWEEIVRNKINGVVFVSGDIHRCDLPLHWPEVDEAYFMPEIISSGLGSHGEHDTLSFVVADFDTTLDDPVMTAHVIDGTGTETMMRRVEASHLQVGWTED